VAVDEIVLSETVLSAVRLLDVAFDAAVVAGVLGLPVAGADAGATSAISRCCTFTGSRPLSERALGVASPLILPELELDEPTLRNVDLDIDVAATLEFASRSSAWTSISKPVDDSDNPSSSPRSAMYPRSLSLLIRRVAGPVVDDGEYDDDVLDSDRLGIPMSS
jgi:hypothetical protein